jgi:hypothetical protein
MGVFHGVVMMWVGGVRCKSDVPAQTTNANFTLSLYSSFPSFMRTYAYAASSSCRVSVISAISPVPVAASVKLSDDAEAYCIESRQRFPIPTPN